MIDVPVEARAFDIKKAIPALRSSKLQQFLTNPVPFLCLCGGIPLVKEERPPYASKKRDRYIARCQQCRSATVFMKSQTLAIWEWNRNRCSRKPDDLSYLSLWWEFTTHREIKALLDSNSRVVMSIRTEESRVRAEKAEWHLFCAYDLFLSTCFQVLKRASEAGNINQ